MRVFLKKLGHNWEIEKVEKKLCSICLRLGDSNNHCHLAGSQDKCRPNIAIKTVAKKLSRKEKLQIELLKTQLLVDDAAGDDIDGLWPTDLLHCGDQILDKELAEESANTLDESNISNQLFLTLLNPEPLLAKMLPTSAYWPKFLGACGRLAVFEDMGEPLKNYASSPWRKRAELSFHLIRLAMLLTENELGLSFYLTDWAPENFAVTTDTMKVSLVDLEHLIVVNTSRLWAERADPHISDNWGSSTSLSFSPNSLCEHSSSDHNYLGLCGIILANSSMSSFRGGLLHSPPPRIFESNMTEILRSCWQSTEVGGREAAARQLQLLLEQELRIEEAELRKEN